MAPGTTICLDFQLRTIVQLKAITKCSRLWRIQVEFISSLSSFCSFQNKHWICALYETDTDLEPGLLNLAFSLLNIKMVRIILWQSNAINPSKSILSWALKPLQGRINKDLSLEGKGWFAFIIITIPRPLAWNPCDHVPLFLAESK